MSDGYEKITVRFSREEIAQIERRKITGGYGSRNAVIFDAVRDMLTERLNGTEIIYTEGVNMGGSLHKSTGKAGQ